MLAFMILIAVIFGSASLNAAEVLFVSDSRFVCTETLNDKSFITLTENGEAVIRDNNGEISKLDCKARVIKVLSETKIAASDPDNIYIYDAGDIKNPKKTKTIKTTGLSVTAITNIGEDSLIVGTETGETFRIRVSNGLIEAVPGTSRSKIVDITVRNNVLIVVPEAEDPKVIDLKSGFLEAFFIQSGKEFVPVRAVQFIPDSTHILAGRGNELLVYDASAGDYTGIKRLPIKAFPFSAPVISVTTSEDGRFYLIGLLDKTQKIIDTKRFDENGKPIIATRTGYNSGAVSSLIVHPAFGVISVAGRNIYNDASTGSGKIILSTGNAFYTNFTFTVEYDDKSFEKKDFYFGYYDNEKTWAVPEGKIRITSTNPDVILENSEYQITSGNPVYISFNVKEDKTEAPVYGLIKAPSQELISVNLMASAKGKLISVYKNQLLILNNSERIMVKLSAAPYLLKTCNKNIVLAVEKQLVNYSVDGTLQYTIPINTKIDHLNYGGDVIVAVTQSEAFIYSGGNFVTKITQEDKITCAALSGDGKLLLLSTGRIVRMFSTENSKEIALHTPVSKSIITQVAFSGAEKNYPSGRYFLTCSEGIIRFYDGIDGTEIIISGIDVGPISFLEFDGDGIERIKFHSIRDNSLNCIKTTTKESLYSIKMEGAAINGAFSMLPNELIAYTATTGEVIVKNKWNELGRIALTPDLTWWITVRGSSVPVVFNAEESLINMFTISYDNKDERQLTPEELVVYRTAELPF